MGEKGTMSRMFKLSEGEEQRRTCSISLRKLYQSVSCKSHVLGRGGRGGNSLGVVV